jgi:hypothetical protein
MVVLQQQQIAEKMNFGGVVSVEEVGEAGEVVRDDEVEVSYLQDPLLVGPQVLPGDGFVEQEEQVAGLQGGGFVEFAAELQADEDCIGEFLLMGSIASFPNGKCDL